MVSEKAMSYTAAHSNIWREYVAKDCSICKRPVPFERIRRHPASSHLGPDSLDALDGSGPPTTATPGPPGPRPPGPRRAGLPGRPRRPSPLSQLVDLGLDRVEPLVKLLTEIVKAGSGLSEELPTLIPASGRPRQRSQSLVHLLACSLRPLAESTRGRPPTGALYLCRRSP